MIKYAKIIENEQVIIFTGTDINWAKMQGFVEMEVEKGYDGNWYVSGKLPSKPKQNYAEMRIAEYPPFSEQLDMIYHDIENWKYTIEKIKQKYPKD